MALDGILLNKIVEQLQPMFPCRIQRIYQISQTEILFQVHGKQGKQQLLISCHSLYNRMLVTTRNYPTPNEPNHFVMVLRKHLEGATIQSLVQAKLDRWCKMTITHHNEIGDFETLYLYIELMGKYANVILVNEQGIVIDALKRIPPFQNSRRTIHPGAAFHETPPQEKKDPFLDCNVDTSISLTQQFMGFSPFLSKEVEYRMAKGQSFSSIMKEIKDSSSIYIVNDNEEALYHCIPLTSYSFYKEYPFFEGFDILYYHKEEKERIKEISGDLYHICKKEKKHQTLKKERLLKELDLAMNCDIYKTYGDLLYMHQVMDTKGQKEITLQNYEDDSYITIPLDPKLDGKQNAQKCYTKYSKLKKGQIHIQQQIDICTREIEYFDGLLEQLDYADFQTAEGIKEELIKGNYMREQHKSKKKQKKQQVQIHTVTLEDGVKISFGKNNIQNDALTHHIAKRNEWWFHTKDYHGAHVVIHQEAPEEKTIRIAAMIAAYYSKGRYSSSIPVNYCLIKNLKKIPSQRMGYVELTKYNTIYIDIDEELLDKLGVFDA